MQKISVGDIIKLRKKHPCGSFDWRVIRTGADVKIQCLGCDRVVMIDRPTLHKRIKMIVSHTVTD